MQDYKREFIDFMAECQVLKFGDFVTKSGRNTPFFINTGFYRDGAKDVRLLSLINSPCWLVYHLKTKALGGIAKETHVIERETIEPIQALKVGQLGGHNPRLHTDEVLIALAICAVTNPTAKAALDQLKNLRNTEAHSTVMLSQVDDNTFKKLGVHLTCEPKHQTKKLYHK